MVRLLWCLALSLSGCYSIRMGLHHNDLFNSRAPIATILNDSHSDPELRKKLFWVKEIMEFGKKEDLNTEGAYTYFLYVPDDVVSYLVQAAYDDRLVFKTWSFPVVGKVPYLGFFKKEERDELADELRSQGFDVRKTAAGAFSSLGWFEDPIFSSMLKREKRDLASLLFHELTHRTFWLPGHVEFNESLAEYVGEEITRTFLQGAERELFELERQDQILFRQWIKAFRSELEEAYRKTVSRDERLKIKTKVFGSYLGEKRPQFTQSDLIGTREWNHAVLLGRSLYAPQGGVIKRWKDCLGRGMTMGKWLLELGRILRQPSKEKPEVRLDAACAARGSR